MKAIIALLKATKRRLSDLVPAPMAAPEPPSLKRARWRIIYALTVLGLTCCAWSSLSQKIQPAALAIIAGLVVFLALQVPVWALAKSRADDAWLLRNRDDA